MNHPDGHPYTAAQVAEAWRCTTRRIQQLAQTGQLNHARDEAGRYWFATLTRPAHIRNVPGARPRRPGNSHS